MKKFSVFLISLLGFVATAQDFQGVATYESKTALPDMSGMRRPNDITPEMEKQMQERMKKALEKTFILTFNRTESTYLEEEKLDAPGENGGFRMMANFMGGGGKHYKNVKDKRFLMEKEVFGKEFLIDDTLPKIKWKMEAETRKIGQYTCYKATATVPTDKTDFRNMRPKKQEAAAKTDEAKKAEAKPTNFMDSMEMAKEVNIVAWYTPDIPVSTGPSNYWGLPGLILEVSDGKTTLLCSKVVMNPKEKAEIKKPSKGKKVTQAEYEDTVTKKMEEMRQMGGPGGPGGGRPPRMN
ncbi:GLPGLI family protein [Flavobacterium psychrotrophum]|uniref:GLPGLI family protein n=1 Tax=Flavobacterium psychrotrophum TaxID=2294119 RepID=UPI000E31F7BA|nr:GLPGLI family protein [Flavobacterium psychrotrophum]